MEHIKWILYYTLNNRGINDENILTIIYLPIIEYCSFNALLKSEFNRKKYYNI